MRQFRFIAAGIVLAILPQRVHAQIGLLEGLFKSLDNVGGFWVYAGFQPQSRVLTGGSPSAPPKQSGMQGPGFAFTFNVGSVGRTRDDSSPSWRFVMALAYSQITGFRSQDRSFDLRGSIRELPRLCWFAEYRPLRRFSPYFGIHMGLVALQSAAIYDTSGALYPIGGSTWEVGGSAGLAVNFKAGNEYFSLFVEPGYTLRNVASLDWGGQNSKVIPARFPRTLRFTGWEIAAGTSFKVPHVAR